MAKIFLNEGTEITVKETKAEIRESIRAEIRKEEDKEKEKDKIRDHFIEVTMVKSISIKGFYEDKELKTDLYYKRILFIYD